MTPADYADALVAAAQEPIDPAAIVRLAKMIAAIRRMPSGAKLQFELAGRIPEVGRALARLRR